MAKSPFSLPSPYDHLAFLPLQLLTMFKHIALFTALSALAAIPVARGAVIDVIVGGAAPNTLKFQPDSVVANIGDTVRFTFKQKNHVSSSFSSLFEG
jgi:plastocyanin